MKKIIVYMFAIVSLVCAGMAFLAEPVSAANVGGVSVYSACKNQYPAAWKWEVFILPAPDYNVMGWRCYLNDINNSVKHSVELDLNKQCKAQYGGGATARFTDFGNPFSWYCNK